MRQSHKCSRLLHSTEHWWEETRYCHMAKNNKSVIYTALVSNVAIAVTKFGAALFTGSSSMLTEGVHSLVDTVNQGLMLYGMRRSNRLPDEVHPFGYGRELYFWSFVVALLIFTCGAGYSIYEGIHHITHPEPMTNPALNYIILAIAFVFEGVSWLTAVRGFRKTRGGMSRWQAFRRSKDPTTFIVLMEDSAALIGIIIAAEAIGLSIQRHDPRIDGVGSILIGILLAVVAFLLARESKGLLIGERANPALNTAISALAKDELGVHHVNQVLTLHMAPAQVVVTVSLDFDDTLTTRAIEQAVMSIERRTKATHTEVVSLFIRPQSHEEFTRLHSH